MIDDVSGPAGADDDGAMSVLRDKTYKLASISALCLITLATVVYHEFEDWSWVDSFYFSAIAVTTVGFGDLTPSTDFTKLFTVFYVFVGISLIGLVLNERLRRHADRAYRKRASSDD